MDEDRRCRFVQGDVVRLPIAGGEWIDVKKELNAGEARHMNAAVVKTMEVGQATTIDPEKVGFAKILEYVVGWSFLNTQRRPEPVTESALRGFDQDTFGEILAVVETHEAACDAMRLARKNGQGGETPLPATSPSLAAAAGALSGSAN